jgi:hypothetical protein
MEAGSSFKVGFYLKCKGTSFVFLFRNWYIVIVEKGGRNIFFFLLYSP